MCEFEGEDGKTIIEKFGDDGDGSVFDSIMYTNVLYLSIEHKTATMNKSSRVQKRNLIHLIFISIRDWHHRPSFLSDFSFLFRLFVAAVSRFLFSFFFYFSLFRRWANVSQSKRQNIWQIAETFFDVDSSLCADESLTSKNIFFYVRLSIIHQHDMVQANRFIENKFHFKFSTLL